MTDPIRLVSVSGGKDSTATLLIALERHPREQIHAAFADTGNEHPLTYEYLRYLEQTTGIAITWLKEDFASWWWQRRDYIRDVWPTKKVRAGELPITPDMIARCLAVFDKGPTGNPYLDLCIIKGRFPSRKAQFCTQFLKTEPLTLHALELVEKFGAVESWQGVRADESASRAHLPERNGEGKMTIYRPILRWNVEQVFAQHRKHGIKPNPLYTLGMGRVGCMPCINAAKNEVLEIAKRFPDQIDRIAEWEDAVSLASKRGNATFFPSPGDNETARERGSVWKVVEWSKTQHGGRKMDWLREMEEPAACASSYGLCE